MRGVQVSTVVWLSCLAPRLVVAGPASNTTPAEGGSVTADRLFEEGRLLSKASRFKEACERFSQSDQLKHTFGTAVNLGECAERDGHVALAWQRYDDAAHTAERTGSRELAKFARERASALAPKLCTIVVRVADPTLPGLTILVRDRTLPPAAEVGILVEPGDVSVTINASSTPALHQNLACAAGAITFVRFPLLSPPAEPSPVKPAEPAASEPPASEPPAPAPSAPALSPPEPEAHGHTAAIVMAATGGAAIATGVVLGIVAKGRQNDAHALCPSEAQSCDGADRANDLIRSGHNLAIGADVAFGIGAAAVITSGILWLAGRSHDSSVAIAPVVSLNQLAITAIGRF